MHVDVVVELQAAKQHGDAVTLQKRNSQLDSQIKQLTSQVTQLKSDASLLEEENKELQKQKVIAQQKHQQVNYIKQIQEGRI